MTIFLRNPLRSTALALIAACVALAAKRGLAVPHYDGLWSVSTIGSGRLAANAGSGS